MLTLFLDPLPFEIFMAFKKVGFLKRHLCGWPKIKLLWLLSFREREFERWTSEAFYDRGKRHGYYRQYRWDHKFLRLGCFIRGQPLKNLYAAKVEGSAWILKAPVLVCIAEKQFSVPWEH